MQISVYFPGTIDKTWNCIFMIKSSIKYFCDNDRNILFCMSMGNLVAYFLRLRIKLITRSST